MKIWTWGSSPRSGSQNAWTWMKNINSASHVSNFWNFFGVIQMISCHNWWLWMKPGYITLTRRQNNNHWRGDIVAQPPQKIPSAKICWKNSHLDFLGSRWHPALWLSSKGSKYQFRGVTHLCCCSWRIFWRKNATESSPRGSCSSTSAMTHQAPVTQKKLAYLGFQCLDHPPYSPDLAPSDYRLFPGLKKKLNGRHFS